MAIKVHNFLQPDALGSISLLFQNAGDGGRELSTPGRWNKGEQGLVIRHTPSRNGFQFQASLASPLSPPKSPRAASPRSDPPAKCPEHTSMTKIEKPGGTVEHSRAFPGLSSVWVCRVWQVEIMIIYLSLTRQLLLTGQPGHLDIPPLI